MCSMVLLQPSSAPLQDPWVSVARLGGAGRRREPLRELEKRTVVFCISYLGTVCHSLGGCWKAGMFLVKCDLSSETVFIY